MNTPAIVIRHLVKNYGERRALDNLDLEVFAGEIFCMLGPNGGGKSTLFRILSTLIKPDDGSAEIMGHDVVAAAAVRENLLCGGALYGLQGKELRERIVTAAAALQITERLGDRVEDLSGGLQRRTEIAKCLLIRPEVLLLDEPSTGLDPAARLDLWAALEKLRAEQQVTILCTTHMMEEAARADRVGILSSGKLVALGAPKELTAALRGDVLSLSTDQGADQLAQKINERYDFASVVIEGEVRIEHPQAYEMAARLAAEFPGIITSLRVARPTLEDVFIARTGHLFCEQNNEPVATHKK